MRHAYTDTQWLITADGHCAGFALGFDFCAEHEFGATYIRAKFGIPNKKIPIGIEDRTVTQVPANLTFCRYDWRSSDKRSKKTWPAAMLHMCDASEWAPMVSGEHAAEMLRMRFAMDPVKNKRFYNPERHDIEVKWGGTDGFAIHVRGQQNVDRLEELWRAIREKRVAIADPTVAGFMRKSLAFVMVDRMSQEQTDDVKEKDLAFLRLHQAAEATEIEAVLSAAGKRWYALSPRWRAGEGSQLLFWLNPCDQKRYAYGWFTAAELQAWASEEGPVVDGVSATEALRAIDVDCNFHLVSGLRAAGVLINGSAEVWIDKSKTLPGWRLLIAEESQSLMADGMYSIEQLQPHLERARRERAAAATT